MSGFAVVRKVPSYRKKLFCEKTLFNLFMQMRYLTFGDFTVPKNCSSQQNY